MEIKRRVGPKGQVVIPKDVRDLLGIKEGSNIVIDVREGSVILKPEKSGKKAVEDYLSVVKKKLVKEVDIKKILEEELEQRSLLPG